MAPRAKSFERTAFANLKPMTEAEADAFDRTSNRSSAEECEKGQVKGVTDMRGAMVSFTSPPKQVTPSQRMQGGPSVWDDNASMG